jgi:hypothetical protein
MRAVGEHPVGALAEPSAMAAYGWDLVDQREQLGDVVAVCPGERHGQGDAGALGQDVVLRTGRARSTGLGPAPGPLPAGTYEESITRETSPVQPARGL